MIMTCSSGWDDHELFQLQHDGPDGVEVVFGWVLPPGIKCPANEAKGIYFLAFLEELRDKVGMRFEPHAQEAHLIMFADFSEGMHASVVADLKEKLGRDIVFLLVKPARKTPHPDKLLE